MRFLVEWQTVNFYGKLISKKLIKNWKLTILNTVKCGELLATFARICVHLMWSWVEWKWESLSLSLQQTKLPISCAPHCQVISALLFVIASADIQNRGPHLEECNHHHKSSRTQFLRLYVDHSLNNPYIKASWKKSEISWLGVSPVSKFRIQFY